MGKTRNRIYTYFIEPSKTNFAHTNEVISKNLAGLNTSSSDFSAGTDILKDVECADGAKHTLYRIPSGLLLMLWTSRTALKINFRIFNQEGRGAIRDVTNWYKKRHQKKFKNIP